MNQYQQTVSSVLPSLPENIQFAINNMNWAEVCLAINTEHNLPIDKLEKFKDLSMMVAVGAISAGEYSNTIQKNLEISQEQAEKLVLDANTFIFAGLQKLAFGDEGYEIAHEKLEGEDTVIEPNKHNAMSTESGKDGDATDDNHIYDLDAELSRDQETVADENLAVRNESTQQSNSADHDLKVKDYYEPINEDDLRGVDGHRIPSYTSLQESQKIDNPDYNQKILEHVMLNESHLPKGDTIDASPSDAEQVKQEGKFLETLKTETHEATDGNEKPIV